MEPHNEGCRSKNNLQPSGNKSAFKNCTRKKKKGSEELSFAILSTGNFNEITAQFYTDHVLMTTDTPIVTELLQLFKFLQLKEISEKDKKLKFDELLVSQFNMNEQLEKLINKEIAKQNVVKRR